MKTRIVRIPEHMAKQNTDLATQMNISYTKMFDIFNGCIPMVIKQEKIKTHTGKKLRLTFQQEFEL